MFLIGYELHETLAIDAMHIVDDSNSTVVVCTALVNHELHREEAKISIPNATCTEFARVEIRLDLNVMLGAFLTVHQIVRKNTRNFANKSNCLAFVEYRTCVFDCE
jgi:hypothetical protein